MTFDGFISYSHAADGRLAPALQRGLHRLAKPWHRRRALWIFRDQTGLAVTPALWSSIQQALDGSEWFVLLASPDAARSPWVNREIEHWIATKPAARILPVVTDGTWEWDPQRGDLTAGSTAVPEALRGVFAEEPLYLDLRWARGDQRLDLRDTRFRDAVAQLAAPMHGVSKDDLEGEDVRQHRRGRRLRRSAVAAVVMLTVVASLAGTLAGRNAGLATASAAEAQRQEQAATQHRDSAERSAEEARLQTEHARTQEERARTAAAETVRQEKLAQEQKAAAERAAAEANRQQKLADQQQSLARRAETLAAEQQALARQQSDLAKQSARETARQREIADQQQSLAAAATTEAAKQKTIARQQQQLAEEAAAEARRLEALARENEKKAKDAAAEARRQEQIALGRKLLNQAKATLGKDPTMALRLGLAANRIQPSAETRNELAGLVASTRRIGGAPGVKWVGYGPGDVVGVVENDRTASLWNVAEPAAPVRLAALGDETYLGEPVFSPDGKVLAAVGGRYHQPLLYDVSDPAAPKLLGRAPADSASWLTFSPDGKTLAAVGIRGKLTLWDITHPGSPALLVEKQLGAYGGPVTFSPDGRIVVTPGPPATVWDFSDRRHLVEKSTLDGTWQRVAHHPDNDKLAAVDKDGNLAIWRLYDPAEPLKVATIAAGALDVAFSPDGRTLATSDRDGTARLWDAGTPTLSKMADLNDHGGAAASLSFSRDGRTLATAGRTEALSLWTVAAHGEPTNLGRAQAASYRSVESSALTSGGRRLTTAHSDGTATVWDMSEPVRPVELATVRVRPGRLTTAAISPRGNLIAAADWLSGDGSVTLTYISDPKAPVTLDPLPDGPYGKALVFSPDGNTLAVAKNSTLELWDLTDPRNPARLAATGYVGDLVETITFSPDGRTVATAGIDRTVRLWNRADLSTPITTITGHADTVIALTFSPDGRTLATGSNDQTTMLWNIADPARWHRQAILSADTSPVRSVAFAPDGHTLATGTSADQVTLWDVSEPSAPVRVVSLARADLLSKALHFHPDGHTLTTSGESHGRTSANIWNYTTLNTLRANPTAPACRITAGGFTEEEWAAYVPEASYQPTC